MKKIILVFLASIMLFTVYIHAVTPPAVTPPSPSGFLVPLKAIFRTIVLTWQPYLQGVANKLLVTLGTIQIALIGMKLVLRENIELNTILGELVRFIILAGFLYWLINNNNIYLQYILDSFIKIAKNVDPAMPGGFNLDDIFGQISNLMTNLMGEASIWSGLKDFIATLIIGAISMFVVILAVAAALKNYVFALFAIQIAPLLFAGAILEYTRPWALNAITLVIKYSAKYLVLILVIYLCYGLFAGAIAAGFTDAGLLALLTLSFITLDLVKEGESMVEGLFSGSHHSSGSQAYGAVKAGTKTAARGTAGAAKGAATGGLSGLKAAYSAGVGVKGDLLHQKAGNFLARAPHAIIGGVAGAAAGSLTGAAKGLSGRSTKNAGKSVGAFAAAPITTTTNKAKTFGAPIAAAARNTTKAIKDEAKFIKDRHGNKQENQKRDTMQKFEKAHENAKKEAFQKKDYDKYRKLGGETSASALKSYGEKVGRSSDLKTNSGRRSAEEISKSILNKK